MSSCPFQLSLGSNSMERPFEWASLWVSNVVCVKFSSKTGRKESNLPTPVVSLTYGMRCSSIRAKVSEWVRGSGSDSFGVMRHAESVMVRAIIRKSASVCFIKTASIVLLEAIISEDCGGVNF